MDHTLPTAAIERATEVLKTGQVPGIIVAVTYGDHPPIYAAIGNDAAGQPLHPETLFPVASITKLATALAVLRLANDESLEIDDPLSHHVPGAAAAVPAVTLRSLLCHTSGLPMDLAANAAPYSPALTGAFLAAACRNTPLEARPWTRVQYSNVAYGLLSLVVEAVTGLPFAQALGQLVLQPLQVEAYLGSAAPRPVAQLSGVRSSHAGTAIEPFNSSFWRELGMPWAGLVTNIAGAIVLARAFAGFPTTFLSPSIRADAVRDQSRSLGGGFAPPLFWPVCPWGLGADLRGTKAPHWAPPEAGADSFGHSGASGTLVWHAPQANTTWAIFGTRTADSGWLLRRAPAIGSAILAGNQ